MVNKRPVAKMRKYRKIYIKEMPQTADIQIEIKNHRKKTQFIVETENSHYKA